MAKSNPTGELDPNEWKELLDATPEHLRDDCLSLYFRCDFDKRDRLLECFDPPHRQRIKGEIERIAKLRSCFAQHVDNVSLVQTMTRARRAWRQVAKDRVPEEVERVRKLRDEAKMDMKKKYRRDLEHLKVVKDWDMSADFMHPNTRCVLLIIHVLLLGVYPLTNRGTDLPLTSPFTHTLTAKTTIVWKKTKDMGMQPTRLI